MSKCFLMSVILSIIVLNTFNSCKKDNLEKKNNDANNTNQNQPNTNPTCDTSGVITYTNTVKGILTQHCTSCHNPSNASGGYDLSEYNGVLNNAEGVLLSIKHDPNYSAMPKGQSKLDDCTIAKVSKWINTGKAQ